MKKKNFCDILQSQESVISLLRNYKNELDFLLGTGKAVEVSLKNLTRDIKIDDITISSRYVGPAVDMAKQGRNNSYAPYSHFNVGASILVPLSQHIVKGCNVENAAYGSTMCAERTAAFSAVGDGIRQFNLVAIVGDFDDSVSPAIRKAARENYIFPCGCCRQVMNEFGGGDLPIVLAKENEMLFVSLLKYLLPGGFGPKSLGVEAANYSRYNKNN
jgi:cytidine deaminase